MDYAEKITTAVHRSLLVLKDGLDAVLEAQGHRLTGTLQRSLEVDVQVINGNVVGTVFSEHYGIYVDAGVPAARVRYPIKIMVAYFQRRGLTLKEATRAAWATRTIHKREGIPTRRSGVFSSTGRRTGFIQEGVDSMLPQVQDIFETETGQTIELEFTKLFEANKIYQTLKLEF